MNSSGMKRGLAVSAVSALALAGLAFTPAAQAQTVAESSLTDIELISQYSGGASARPDGNNSTVSVVAGMPTQIGGQNVNHVKFAWSPAGAGTWTPIGGNVIPQDGVAAIEFAAPNDDIDIRAQAFNNADIQIGTDAIQGNIDSDPTQGAVDFDHAPFAQVGQWDDEIVVRGKWAGGLEGVSVSARGPEATTGGNSADLNGQNFVGVIDLGTNNDSGDPTDQVFIGAQGNDLDDDDTDDVTVVTVYDQEINDVTKTLVAGDSTNVPSGSGDDTGYVLHVTDQNGNDIQGADIYEANGAGAPTDGNGDVLNDETDVNGELEVTLNEADIDGGADLDPAANAQLTYYVVDVNSDGNYDSGTDWLIDVRQTSFAQVATSVVITNELGNVMDDEENSDLTITVKDQFGNPYAGADVLLRENRVGHDPVADPAGTYVNLPGTTNAAGQQTINFTSHSNQTEVVTFDAYVNNDGNPNPTAGDGIATPYVVDTDTTEVLWDEGNRAQRLVGSTDTFTGILVQENTGKPLPNRPMDIDYAAGTGSPGNSLLAPQSAQPAGTTRGGDFQANVVTGADGTFGVAVTDPTPPDGQELDAELTVSSDSLPNNLDAENDPETLEIDFLRSVTPASVVIINPLTGDEQDGLLAGVGPAIFGDAADDLSPGGLGVGLVEVRNSDDVLLSDIDVDLTIDEGYFVDLEDPFDGTPAVGQPVDFKDAGKTATVTTDDDGEAELIVNIERHEGFDDDGEVDDNLSANAGPASDGHDLTWNTFDAPINPRATDPLVVELSEDQESSILPKARAGDPVGSGQLVDYDVETYDLFGNRTSQDTNTTDNTPLADVWSGGFNSRFDLGQPAIRAFADEATSQVLEVEADDARKFLYVDDPFTSEFDPTDPFAFGVGSSVDIEEETDAINWYNLDFDASTFTLNQQGANTVPVQSAVTMVLHAIDQEGQPITGLGVDFLRGGPGDDDDDGCQFGCFGVDGNGNAFYDFVGGSAGTATVTAIAYDDNGIRVGTVGTDTVEFGGGGQVAIQAKLSGKSKKGKDVMKVTAPSNADGAKVKLQKKTKNGWKQVGKAKSLNLLGKTTFKVKDRNGNKVTKYRALVGGTSDTKGDRTNVVRQK